MKVQIQTTQNVDIEYDLANVGDRIGAALIDNVIRAVYAIIAIMVMAPMLATAQMEESGSMMVGMYFLIVLLPVLTYSPICEILMDGQTFGKKALQIKVVRLDGNRASISAYLIRWLLSLVEIFAFNGGVALASILVTRNGQRLGDIAAGTTVVKVRRMVSLSQTIFARIDDDYTPVFPNVTTLGDRDIAIIKEVITSRERASNPMVLGRLSRNVKQALGVDTDLPSLKFLRTVVKDYNYYAGQS